MSAKTSVLLPVVLLVACAAASESAMLKLFHRVHQQEPQNNLLLSPYGIEQCFGMIACGAGEKSGKELTDILGLPRYTADMQIPSPENTTSAPKRRQWYHAEFNSFNAVLYNRKYTLNPDFIRLAAGIYNGKIYKLDFTRTTECVNLLNSIVRKESRNMFDQVFKEDSLKKDDAALLMNVFYFKSAWDSPFEKYATAPCPFYIPGQAPQKRTMMSQTLRLPYYDDGKFKAVIIPYADYNYQLLVLMAADKALPFNEVTGFLAEKGIKHFTGNSSSRNKTDLLLPKLKLENDRDLVKLLQKQGMQVIFDPLNGDIDRMIKNKQLYISEARQLIKLNLDEEGTEVAATTYASAKVGSAPMLEPPKINEFHADHPFVLVLFRKDTGNILLTAAVVDPQSGK